jgi:hypothetical protein
MRTLLDFGLELRIGLVEGLRRSGHFAANLGLLLGFVGTIGKCGCGGERKGQKSDGEESLQSHDVLPLWQANRVSLSPPASRVSRLPLEAVLPLESGNAIKYSTDPHYPFKPLVVHRGEHHAFANRSEIMECCADHKAGIMFLSTFVAQVASIIAFAVPAGAVAFADPLPRSA